MAGCLGACAAQRKDSAAGLVDNVGKNAGRFIAGMALLVQRPAFRDRVAPLRVDLQLSSRNHRGRRVKGEGNRVRRHRERNGVRAQHSLLAECRHQDGFRVAHADTDQAFLHSHPGVVACNSVMVGVPHRHDTHTALLCLFDGKIHGVDTQQLAHGVIALDGGAQRRLLHDLRLRIHLHHTLGDLVVIPDKTLDSVGLDSVAVRRQQNVRDLLTLFLRKAVTLEALDTEIHRFLIFYLLIVCHAALLSCGTSRFSAARTPVVLTGPSVKNYTYHLTTSAPGCNRSAWNYFTAGDAHRSRFSPLPRLRRRTTASRMPITTTAPILPSTPKFTL